MDTFQNCTDVNKQLVHNAKKKKKTRLYMFILPTMGHRAQFLWTNLCELLLSGGVPTISLVTLPTALVRPSRKRIFMPTCRYSGFLMKRKCTIARSPVRRQSWLIAMICAVWRMLPQWTVGESEKVSKTKCKQ